MTTLALLLALATAHAVPLKKLEPAERDHLAALEVWMDDKARKAFLKLKTREQRDAWLKSQGLWDRFYQYDDETRAQILAGKVRPGWTSDQVYMAWGKPHARIRNTNPKVARSERLTYLFEVAASGAILVWEPGSKQTHGAVDRFRYEVEIHDGVVVELKKKAGWD